MAAREDLVGRLVILEPLGPHHTSDLVEAALHGQSMFEQKRTVHLHDEAEVRAWMQESLRLAHDHEQTGSLPYAIVEVATARAAGAAWYRRIDWQHRQCELGWTWVAPRLLGSGASAEARMLLLEHAFGRGMVRVELRIDAWDDASRDLLETLGVPFEGVLRASYVDRDGSVNDTHLYAATRDDLPRVRERAAALLGGAVTDEECAASIAAVADARADRGAVPGAGAGSGDAILPRG